MNSNSFDGEYEVWKAIDEKEIGEDIYIYGSSRTYVHINPKILDEELNIFSYNLGLNGQKIRIQKYRNDYLIKNGYKPKNVIINLDIDALQKRDIFWKEQYLVFILNNKMLFDLVKNELNLNSLDLYIPMYRYRNLSIFKSYISIIYNDLRFNSKNIRDKGFKGKNGYWDENQARSNPKVDLLRKKDLFEMIEDLQKVNTNVILINSPEYISQIESQINRDEIIKLYDSIARTYNIPFIDYSKDSINYRKELFYNPNHLNAKGADIFTKKLAEDIRPYIKR